MCQGVLENRDDGPRANRESWRNISVFLVNVYHVLFDTNAGINLPGLYALSDWRSWSRRYVWFYLGFLRFYLMFYKHLFFCDIKIKYLKIFFICVFITVSITFLFPILTLTLWSILELRMPNPDHPPHSYPFPIHPDWRYCNPISDLLIPPCCAHVPALLSVVMLSVGIQTQ